MCLAGKGFTLIELTIVVAIIGVLAAIAIPNFASLLTRSQEATTMGNLGTMRTAISNYYSDTEGAYPTTITALIPKYIRDIPTSLLPER